MKHTSQQSTKKGLNKELEEYFRLSKATNWSKQAWTPNCHPLHDLTQPEGWENSYVWFGYGLETISNQNWGQVSGSMNANTINADK